MSPRRTTRRSGGGDGTASEGEQVDEKELFTDARLLELGVCGLNAELRRLGLSFDVVDKIKARRRRLLAQIVRRRRRDITSR